MRDTIVGLVLAVILVGGLFAADKYAPNQRPQAPVVEATRAAETVAADVHPGFVGSKMIGLWLLQCDAKPSSVAIKVADTSKTAAAGQPQPTKTLNVPLGRCKTSLFYRRKDNPRAIVMAITFRQIGAMKAFGVFILMPPIVKQGDAVALQIPKKGYLRLPVAGCDAKTKVCVARGALQAPAEAQLMDASNARVVIPRPDKKLGALPLPTVGLRQAVEAMKRAES